MKNYYRHKIENLLVVDRIVTIHLFELRRGYRSEGESHDFWELVFADEGDLLCTADGKEIRLREGEVLFHKPGEFHTLAADGKSAPRVLIASFSSRSEAMRWFEGRRIALPRKDARLLFAIAEEGRRTFDLSDDSPSVTRLRPLAEPVLGGMQMIANYLEILLIGLMRRETERADAPVFVREGELEGRIAREIIDYLEKNIGEKRTIADVGAALNYDKSYLYRQFRRATGKSVMAYFTEMKIDRAKRWIREGEMNVTEIAAALGFDTPNYFTKTFRRLTGVTPTAYRRRSEKD